MLELAAAAGVGRSTLYRHFPSRRAVHQALDQRSTGQQEATPSKTLWDYRSGRQADSDYLLNYACPR